MLLNAIYRYIRYRLDDPLRDLHVPKRDRLDVDEDDWAGTPFEASDTEHLEPGEVMAEKDLI